MMTLIIDVLLERLYVWREDFLDGDVLASQWQRFVVWSLCSDQAPLLESEMLRCS
jgi:hypothetical protein